MKAESMELTGTHKPKVYLSTDGRTPSRKWCLSTVVICWVILAIITGLRIYYTFLLSAKLKDVEDVNQHLREKAQILQSDLWRQQKQEAATKNWRDPRFEWSETTMLEAQPYYTTPHPYYGRTPYYDRRPYYYATPTPYYGRHPYYDRRPYYYITPTPYYGRRPYYYATPTPNYGRRPYYYATPTPYYGRRPYYYATPTPNYARRPYYGRRPYYARRPYYYATPTPSYGRRPHYTTPHPYYATLPYYNTTNNATSRSYNTTLQQI